MLNESTRIIEVSGVKLEVDLRTVKKIDSFKVGDRIKVLIKDYSGYKSHPAAIVGIDNFQNLPTVVIAYIANPLSNKDGEVNFAYLNAQSKDIEICPMCEDDIVPTRDTILTMFNRSIQAKEAEIEQIRARKEWFLRQYGTAFGVGAAEVAASTT